ncbi:hypothetical protein RUM44_009477 [Polyplax serrata]|uniref:Uncharacterized protein n=1 Tax=Polyplax serrata TaxID=468196 RepID=A0ABR1AST5_POLSC
MHKENHPEALRKGGQNLASVERNKLRPDVRKIQFKIPRGKFICIRRCVLEIESVSECGATTKATKKKEFNKRKVTTEKRHKK